MASSSQEIALAYYVRQQRIVRRYADQAQRAWRSLDLRHLDVTWQYGVSASLVGAFVAGQGEAAAHSDAYVAAVLAADGLDSQPGGKIDPFAFAGVAADGRPLKSLAYESVLEAKWLLEEAGQAEVDAMIGGLEKLLRAVSTEVADAGRTATGASIAGNRTINGYIRVVNPPACARCLILAGKEFGWNAGFQRHPKCDCIHVPAKLLKRGGRRHPGVFDTKAYFEGLSAAEQNRLFTNAGAQAIRDGASISSVVNARRGMYTASAYGRTLAATRDSATRRGAWFRAERQRAIQRGLIPSSGRGFRLKSPRLRPEEIYRLAGGRSEAIAMLHRFGYMT
ncbi:VG15 protein [Streptomyces sp. NPDC004436]